MAFLSSLMQVLRQSTEKAIAHVRPPGPIKHGGVPLWKQHFALTSRANTFTPSASATIHIADRSAVSNQPLLNLFNSVVEHAIAPVFKGIKTEHSVSHRAVKVIIRNASNDFGKPNPAKGHFDYGRPPRPPPNRLNTTRPRMKSVAEVGFRPAENFNAGIFNGSATTFVYTMAPSLGLRAAADELEDQAQNWKRQRTNKRFGTAIPSCRSSERSSLLKRASWNYHQKIAQAESIATSIGLESLLLSQEIDFSDSCSSFSFIESVNGVTPSTLSSDDTYDLFNREPEVEPVHTITTLYVPMLPEVYRALFGHQTRQITEETELVDLIHAQMDDYQALRLRIIRPLEYGLQDGFLAQLHPEGWNAGQLEWGPEDPLVPYLPVRFINRTRQEVLDMLQYDVEDDVYRVLATYVLETTVQDDLRYPTLLIDASTAKSSADTHSLERVSEEQEEAEEEETEDGNNVTVEGVEQDNAELASLQDGQSTNSRSIYAYESCRLISISSDNEGSNENMQIFPDPVANGGYHSQHYM